MNIQFLYLRAFSKTGGIEKFNKLFMLAMSHLAQKNNLNYDIISAYDASFDSKYVSKQNFKGFDKSKFLYAFYAILNSFKNNITILGHVNLSIIGLIIKLLRPNHKVFLIVHGIEIWEKQSFFKRKMLKKADKIVSVSNFTKNKILENYPYLASKFYIFPNTFDPLFDWKNKFKKPYELFQKYGLNTSDNILLTVSRLEYSEKYKGYDKVFEIIPKLVPEFPNLKYVIVGKGDEIELKRIFNLIQKYKIENYVKIIGFIPDNELINHYLLADIFIMPSKKEGFGIVFIEAGLCGLQVITGNKDASKEALIDGSFGEAIDPDNNDEIYNSIKKSILNPLNDEQKYKNKKLIENTFGFEAYKVRLHTILYN